VTGKMVPGLRSFLQISLDRWGYWLVLFQPMQSSVMTG
jgi:hypothetical protein